MMKMLRGMQMKLGVEISYWKKRMVQHGKRYLLRVDQERMPIFMAEQQFTGMPLRERLIVLAAHISLNLVVWSKPRQVLPVRWCITKGYELIVQ